MIVQKTSLIFKIIALVLLFNPIIYLIYILIRKKYINNNWLLKFSIVTSFNLISFIIIYLYNNIKLDIIYCYISICSIGILTYLQIFYLNHNNITPNTNFIRPKLEEINITDTEKKLDDNKPNFPVKALSYRGILFKRLEVYLSKTSAWQDPDLSISKLARELGTNRNTLLQSIKDNGYSNYVYYINSIRIDRFIKIIENDEINNFQDAFYEVGFRSRATAIRNFKNLTGVTPSEYFNNKTKLTNQ